MVALFILAVFVFGLICLFFIYVGYSLHRDINRFRTAPITVDGPLVLLDSHHRAISDFERLGFTVVHQGSFNMEGQSPKPVVLLLDSPGTTLAEVTNLALTPEEATVSVMSSLEDGNGWLSTQTVSGLLPGHHHLLQVFPDADPASLVASHQQVLAFLQREGVRIDRSRHGRAVDHYVAALRFGGIDHPPLLPSIFGVLRLGECPSCGSVLDHPDFGDHLRAIRTH